LASQIETAIEQFPTLKKRIGNDRLLSIAKEDLHSPIIYYLVRSQPDLSKVQDMLNVLSKEPKHVGALIILDHLVRPYHTLKHLDNCLASIQNESKLTASLEHLLHSDSFWQGYSEIEVASSFKGIFGKVELEPSLGSGKNADVRFTMNSHDVFVEVTVPKMHYKFVKLMEESAEKHEAIQLEAPVERASDKILEELEHFADVLPQVRSIIIINLNQTEIEDIDIDDSLMGVSKLVVVTDRSTGKVETRVARGDWTAFSKDAKLAKVGAIVCYKRDFAINGTVFYEKKIFALSFDKPEWEPLLKLFP
jgi:hypothetical protein